MKSRSIYRGSLILISIKLDQHDLQQSNLRNSTQIFRKLMAYHLYILIL